MRDSCPPCRHTNRARCTLKRSTAAETALEIKYGEREELADEESKFVSSMIDSRGPTGELPRDSHVENAYARNVAFICIGRRWRRGLRSRLDCHSNHGSRIAQRWRSIGNNFERDAKRIPADSGAFFGICEKFTLR